MLVALAPITAMRYADEPFLLKLGRNAWLCELLEANDYYEVFGEEEAQTAEM